MKRVLAATALIGFALLLGGCSREIAYVVRNETTSELIVVVTKTSCEIPPQEQDDYVHEATVKAGRTKYNYDSWKYDQEVQCFRVLNPDREVILEQRYRSDRENRYSISATQSASHKWIASKDHFPGPPLSERITDRISSIAETILLVALIALVMVLYMAFMVASIPFGFGGGLLRLGVPAMIVYFIYAGARKLLDKRRRPPLN